MHAYLVTVSHPRHGDTAYQVDAAEPMLAAESAERTAWMLLGGKLPKYFAYKVERAPLSRRGRELLRPRRLALCGLEGQVE